MKTGFSWSSYLGLSSIGFMTIAVVYFIIGLAGVILILKYGSGNLSGSYYYSASVDEKIFGLPIKLLNTQKPEWGQYMSRMIIALCSLMIPLGFMQFCVARFALTQGEPWALLSLFISSLLMLILYWFWLIIPVMKQFQAGYFDMWHPYAFVPTVLLVPSFILGWLGLH